MGNIEISKKRISLNLIVNEISELLNQTIRNKEISFINNIDDNFIVYVDSSTISTVIRNLLSNAIKFTPRGGEIIISATKKSGRSFITISDTGIGISPMNIDDLFDVTRNSSKPGTENETGTGLGLVLCKELTELNNGSIIVESDTGKGSNFIISLPSS